VSSEKLVINTQVVGNVCKVDFIGNINEDADFEKIIALKMPEYHFNFDQVAMINSCGIREWISLITKIGTQATIKYFNCRQIVVEQINVVHGFITDKSQIQTFYTPYYCDKCNLEKQVLVEVKSINNRKAPAIKCDKCSSKMEFDAIEEHYFSFIPKK